MFSKLNRIIKFSLLGALGFGAGGAIFGYAQTTDDSWLWLLGLAATGLIVGAILGFFLGGRKVAINLAIYWSIAGVIGGYITGDSDFEPWLQLTTVGLVFGVALGAAFAFSGTRGRESKDKELHCSECNGKVDKDDNYCPNCGTEFE